MDLNLLVKWKQWGLSHTSPKMMHMVQGICFRRTDEANQAKRPQGPSGELDESRGRKGIRQMALVVLSLRWWSPAYPDPLLTN
jgi:hypothetical protein